MGLAIISLTPFINEIIAYMNIVRIGMIYEDGGSLDNYQDYNGILDLLREGVKAFPYFLMKPLPWEASNTFQLIQSFENILILLFLFIFSIKSYKQNVLITNRWIIFLIFSMTIYGLVIENFGTAARYKYPIFLTYVIGLSYELYKTHNYKYDSIFKIKIF